MLTISDTRHLTGDKPKKFQFMPDLSAANYDPENTPFSDDLQDAKNAPVLSDSPPEIVQPAAPQVAKTGDVLPGVGVESGSTTPQTLIDLEKTIDETNKLIESGKPVYDQDREKRLQRIGRAQKFTDALTVLAQVIGAGAGASVPQMQLNNSASTSAAIQKMRDLHENEERRYQLIALQEKMRQIGLRQAEAQRLDARRYESDEADRRSKQQYNDALNLAKEKHAMETDPDNPENKRKDEEQANRNALSAAQVEYYRKGADSRAAYSDYQRSRAGTTTKEGKAYMYLYDDPTGEPVAQIDNESQARAYYTAILANKSVNNPLINDLREMQNEGSVVDIDQVKDVVSKYWRYVKPEQTKPAERPEWIPDVKQDESYEPGYRKREANQPPAFLQDPAKVKELDEFDALLQRRYGNDIELRKAGLRTYLIKQGLTREQADQLINENI